MFEDCQFLKVMIMKSFLNGLEKYIMLAEVTLPFYHYIETAIAQKNRD